MPEIKDDVQVEAKAELPKAQAYAFDLDLFLFTEYKKMQRDNMMEAYRYIEPLITRWNFKIQLEDGAMKKLPLTDSGAMFASIMEALTEEINAMEKTIKVDFSLKNWTMETIEILVGYEQAGKWEKMADMVLGIVRFPKAQPKLENLTAVQGQAAFNAVMNKWKAVLEGKN